MRSLSLLGASVVIVATTLAPAQAPAAPAGPLESILADVHPDVRKWASVARVAHPDAEPRFTWFHLGDSADAVDFWPASTIKIYAVVAVVEWLNEQELPLESTISFERRGANGAWILDCARTVPEMISEVFRTSSNEDYTLLLRTLGIDHVNTRFLIPAKGFPHSALMRDYVTHRPIVYENDEPQRITVWPADGEAKRFEHSWSGISYAEARGATVLSSTTGNCTSTRELADCLRRIVFHDALPESERFAITSEQARLIRDGDPQRGVWGLENRLAGDYGWSGSGEVVFPEARYFHKAGLISSYCLDVCYLSDAASDTHLILAIAAETGSEDVVRAMALAIYRAADQLR
ncbi:MAG: serine hydrolase [Planctomycetes bacterium]|nr:serine hydrolase [Planctomycetota bacterium]